jgi:hypothetical protein
MLGHPVVADVVGAGSIGGGSVEVEGQERPDWRVRGVGRIGLLERHALIGESTDAAVGTKVMIERAIFLNQDHDMLDVR